MSAPTRVPSFGSSLMNLGNSSNNFSIGNGLAFLGDSLRGTLSVGSNLGLLASQSIGNLAAMATSNNNPAAAPSPPNQMRVPSIGSNLCGLGAIVRNASMGSLCDIEQLGDEWGKTPNPIGSPSTWQSPKEPTLTRLPSCGLFRVDSVIFSPNRAKLLDERDQKDREWQSRLAKLSEGKALLSPRVAPLGDESNPLLEPEPVPPKVLDIDDEPSLEKPLQVSPESEPSQGDQLLPSEPKPFTQPEEERLLTLSKASDTDDRASSVSVETPALKRKQGKDLKGSTSAMSRKMTEEEHSVMLYKRKLRNRQSAARSRKRHQAVLQSLQADLNELAVKADQAVASCENCSSKNAKLRESNMRLYCENAYLRAQLSMIGQDGTPRPLPAMSLNGA